MKEDYSDEVKNFIKKYTQYDFEYGKDLKFLTKRMGATQEEINNEILNCDNLSFANKQIKDSETRYALFFIYNKKEGRKYIITFREQKLRIITAFPLGRKTLKRYRKKGLNIWLRH